MSWQEALEDKQELFLATSSKNGEPRVIVVLSRGLVKDKLLLAASQMKTTLENIKENSKVSLVAKHGGEYYRIKGRATIYSSGNYLKTAVARSKPPLPTSAVVVDIEEIFDLDNQKRIL